MDDELIYYQIFRSLIPFFNDLLCILRILLSGFTLGQILYKQSNCFILFIELFLFKCFRRDHAGEIQKLRRFDRERKLEAAIEDEIKFSCRVVLETHFDIKNHFFMNPSVWIQYQWNYLNNRLLFDDFSDPEISN